MSATSARTAPSRTSLWIYHPGLDLIVGCGAWSAPLLLLSYFSSVSSVFVWSVGFYALALLFNYPHYMATLYRAYHTAEDFQKYRIFTLHITALLVLTLALAHYWPHLLVWLFTIYLTWSQWHYSGQNYGLFMMFARRAGAQPSTAVRRALYSAFLLSYLILFLSFHTGPSSDPLFISLGLPVQVAGTLRIVLGLAFIACGSFGFRGILKQIGFKACIPSLTLFSTQFFWFLLPSVLFIARGLQVPQSRYSTGVLAVMHSAQYLWITSYYARREALEGKNRAAKRWRPFAYFAVLILGGIALFVPGPWLASYVFHVDFTASFLIFTALVNIHHFILDGAIWKLRDGRIAKLLLGQPQQIAATATEVSGKLMQTARWLAGGTRAASVFRITPALVLVGWAVLDQVRFVKAVNQDDLPSLQRAAALNPYDSSVQMRIARKQREAGDKESAIAAWQRAVAADKTNPTPRNAFLKFLIEEQRFDQAYALTREWISTSHSDPDLFVNHGILANQLGHTDEAIGSWQDALTLDRSQTPVHLYLADALESQGHPDFAIPHYVAYLEKVALSGADNRPAPASIVPVILRLAHSQEVANRPIDAEKSFELANKIAAQAGPKLQVVAVSAEADLKARHGKMTEALRLYQSALKLDALADDRRAEAIDWYNYARFLRQQQASPRLAYACLIKSAALLEAAHAQQENAVVHQAMKELESRLAGAAAEIRKNPQPDIDQAISLTLN